MVKIYAQRQEILFCPDVFVDGYRQLTPSPLYPIPS